MIAIRVMYYYLHKTSRLGIVVLALYSGREVSKNACPSIPAFSDASLLDGTRRLDLGV